MSDFRTTRWSVVRAAARDHPERRLALEQMIRSYWMPLYAFVRRRGESVEAAQDLTQGFFVRLMERDDFAGLDPSAGRFRAFLLASMKNYLSRERERRRAQKRRGDLEAQSLEFDSAERLYLEDRTSLDAEQLFERRWALTVLRRALDRLRAEYAATGRAALFDALSGYVTGESDVPYAEIGAELGLATNGVKTAVRRLRQRLGEALRREVAETVLDPAEIEDELKNLLRAL